MRAELNSERMKPIPSIDQEDDLKNQHMLILM